jgi:hypothetical protein
LKLMTNNDTPLIGDEFAILARAGYVYVGGSAGLPPYLTFRYNGMADERRTRAEWRAIIADLPDFWSPASRDEIRAAVATLREPELRELLDAVLAIDDPALLVAVLRGSAIGLAARVREGRTRNG